MKAYLKILISVVLLTLFIANLLHGAVRWGYLNLAGVKPISKTIIETETENKEINTIQQTPQKVFLSYEFEIFGRVQGVHFRKYTEEFALENDIKGWVMNTPHKTVVGEIQGDKENIEKMKNWLCTKGSKKSIIKKCEFKNEKEILEPAYPTFSIRKQS